MMFVSILFLISFTFILFNVMSIQLANNAYADPPEQLSIISKRIGDVRDELNRTSEALAVNDTELANFHLTFANNQLQVLQEFANLTPTASNLTSVASNLTSGADFDTLEPRNITK